MSRADPQLPAMTLYSSTSSSEHRASCVLVVVVAGSPAQLTEGLSVPSPTGTPRLAATGDEGVAASWSALGRRWSYALQLAGWTHRCLGFRV